ncbi:unnamed protein product [Toxocara canis]|uniref:GH18 domain-containing protein n=1 Tax=Toxocara canis TaxID=6265 RepID=A0A183TXK1_TOXCA|nr:unnamed protein product [Toxocara canis]
MAVYNRRAKYAHVISPILPSTVQVDWFEFYFKSSRAYGPADLASWSGGSGQYEFVNDLKKADRGLRTLLSIGGWTFGTTLSRFVASFGSCD